ncbi:hypothetical protein PC119_g10776 [Phytophthora cactorum]|nr:hypothetical protein PC114_g11720 [Phytophthora cactorum]KAG3018173.1 hypothetical protein PC119_g10776 [Phytophthora cactorum]KAG3167820.1 hypothetical protein C6341_g11598 [Phytophthora cactorum]
MRVISSLRQVLGTTLATTPRHKAFHMIVEITTLMSKAGGGRASAGYSRLDAFVHAVNVYAHRQAVDVDEMQLRAEWVESPQAVPNRVVDLERQVAQLHGPLVSLLRLPRDLWPRHLLLTSLPWIRHCMLTRL